MVILVIMNIMFDDLSYHFKFCRFMSPDMFDINLYEFVL